ncbi:MAG: DUF815 domain-containing protein [Sneathiella sp.]|nr:DUF815 domain-containing protein [Sneathiella sp.]
MSKEKIVEQLKRIADSLERIAPGPQETPDINSGEAFVWQAESNTLRLIPKVNHVDMSMLHGIDRVKDILLDNTLRFAKGLPANNALLWGARGMGKSSLVKAAHALVNRELGNALVLVEIHREDIPSLPVLMQVLQKTKRRCVLFCDDLSFDSDDST